MNIESSSASVDGSGYVTRNGQVVLPDGRFLLVPAGSDAATTYRNYLASGAGTVVGLDAFSAIFPAGETIVSDAIFGTTDDGLPMDAWVRHSSASDECPSAVCRFANASYFVRIGDSSYLATAGELVQRFAYHYVAPGDTTSPVFSYDNSLGGIWELSGVATGRVSGSPASVPEPGTFTLLAIALLAFAVVTVARRRAPPTACCGS